MRKKKDSIGVQQRQKRRNLGYFSNDNAIDPEGSRVKPIDFETTDMEENNGVETSGVKLSKWKKFWNNRKQKRLAKKQREKSMHPVLRMTKKTIKFTLLAVIVVVGVLGLQSYLALRNVIDRGEGALALQENIDPASLKGEGDGRVNIMLLGIGGAKHVAGDLADSIMIASIDPFNNHVAMISIPRDLYLEIPGFYSSRVNEAHAIGEDQRYKGGGVALTRETLQKHLDIKINMFVRVDFQAFIQAVDTVGGVDITLDTDVWDPNFDWQFGKDALNLKAGDNHLDGVQALLLSRARGASGRGIGVSNDFVRAERQRDILIALKDKVLSLGTFANPAKISSLINTASKHVKTDIQISEMLRLYEISENISNKKVKSWGLSTEPDNFLNGTNIGGASVLVPRSGNFNEIQKYLRSKLMIDSFIRLEKPTIDVLNGTNKDGMATKQANILKSYGYKVKTVGDAPKKGQEGTVIYDMTGDNSKYCNQENAKPCIRRYLELRFDTTVQSGDDLPEGIETTSDYVIILGR